jgi:succinate dehydrogenase hydrophobic anchor subunit
LASFRYSVGIIAIIKGTINDPTVFPPPSKAHGSHHWAFERLVSAALIPLTAAAAVTGGSHYPVLDGVLAISLIVHSHIGVRFLNLRMISGDFMRNLLTDSFPHALV